MALKELRVETEGQLEFNAFRLADCVRDLLAVETEKKEANEEWNQRIKALKKSIAKLSGEIEGQRGRNS